MAQMMKSKLEAVGCNCLIIHFADLVKYFLKEFYGWDGQKDENGRALLQTFGTNHMRATFPDYWSEVVAKFVSTAGKYEDFDVAIIPDARFENEISVVKKYNPDAITIRINRYNGEHPYFNPLLTEEQLAHSSETSLDDYTDWDYIVDNYTLQELEESVETILADTGLLA